MRTDCIILIGIALILLCTGVVSAGLCGGNNQYVVPEGRYLTVDTFGNKMLSFYPVDEDAPYGRFADGTPIPDGYMNPAPPHVGGQIPAWQREAMAEMQNRPHINSRDRRMPVR